MTPFGFLDTNILLYSISRGASEAAKRERAITLLEREDVGLSIQVLGEFYVQATRATRSNTLPPEISAGLVETWFRFPVQEITRVRRARP